eukprot:4403635-Prymnesium_polylepis.1
MTDTCVRRHISCSRRADPKWMLEKNRSRLRDHTATVELHRGSHPPTVRCTPKAPVLMCFHTGRP